MPFIRKRGGIDCGCAETKRERVKDILEEKCVGVWGELVFN